MVERVTVAVGSQGEAFTGRTRASFLARENHAAMIYEGVSRLPDESRAKKAQAQQHPLSSGSMKFILGELDEERSQTFSREPHPPRSRTSVPGSAR